MSEINDMMDALSFVGLKPIIFDENTDLSKLPIEAINSIKTNGKRNKQAGHSWEREIVKRINELGFSVGTTRNLSRARDAQKVDIMGTNERVDGYFPANIQAKNEARVTKFQVHLAEMPVEPNIQNVVAFKQTTKTGSKFMKQGEYAIMYFDSFLYYLKQERLNKINWDYIKELERQIGVLKHTINHMENDC